MSHDESMQNEKGGFVPENFPRAHITGAVPGAQPKILATMFEGRFYMSGRTPPEVAERWRICEDLAVQLSVKSVESKNGKCSHMTESEILQQYYERLIATHWTSTEEARWVTGRVAEILGWHLILPL
jgi:hypothetical protein